ncbi:MAG: ABC transporter ATP-binding protein [Spirochaetales bacterium]|nr:ABC transporter ATP-binding protein [Spirochaetales bacterium]
MSDIICRIRDLKFAYEPGVPVLSIDELNLERGGILTFRGHNGSGKTTLLKVLAGLLPVSRGEVIFNDGERSVLVQQEPYLFQGSVKQNLLYPLKFRGVSSGKERSGKIAEVLEFVGLGGFEKRKARHLSGGESKRVAIARALMAESPVLMLDEPNANVDRATSGALEELFLHLKASGITVILSTHDDRLAYRVSDRIVDLEGGVPFQHYETILKGSYEYRDGMYSLFHLQGTALSCPSRHGEYTTAVLSPSDVLLSKDRVKKEGYNQLDGVVEAVSPSGEDRYIITVNCGFPLRASVPGAAYELLKPLKGMKLYALFSPSAVHLF